MDGFYGSLIVARDESLDPLRPIRFRRAFAVGEIERATLRVTACGIHRTMIDGAEVNDELLAPGWTSYHHRQLVREVDVTERLAAGEHVLGIEVAEGWWRGRLGWNEGIREVYGTEIGPVAELEILGADGSVERIATDATWRWAPGAVLTASLYDGEHHDLRLDDDWAAPGYDDGDWTDAVDAEFDASALFVGDVPPVRRIETLPAQRVWTSPAGKTLVDFGQNASGWLRVKVPPVADRTITFRHAEVLENDELGTRPLRNAKATDVIETSGADGLVWEPRFTVHGFRYVQVDGWPGELTADDLEMVVVHTDMEPIGSFACSHPGLTQLHENIRWSAKGNFVSVPTDCPQRDERLGWTGDLQVFAPTASFLFDCRSMLGSWLEDLAAQQADADGVVPIIVPTLKHFVLDMPFAGWSDAAVIVPWVLYERFGEPAILEQQYESMCSWVDAVAARSSKDGLWRTWQLGDWLDPSAPPDNAAGGRTDGTMVGGAYQVHVTGLLAGVAGVLGRADDAERYGALAKRQRDAFRAEYVTPRGRLMSDSPTAYALAICFDLLDGDEVATAHRRIRELVEADQHHIGTGFLGTPLICDALVAAGAVDDMFKLLTQTTCPSWLYPVSMGATTVWERWDSMLPDGSINPGEMTSFNHYAFGAVADFLHRRIAGLAPAEPGYRVLDVRPLVGGGLTSADARHRTPQGEASVAWTRDGADFSVRLTVPDGCEARVGLPDGSADSTVGPGDHTFSCTVRPATDDPVHPEM